MQRLCIGISAVRKNADQHRAIDHLASVTVDIAEFLSGEIDLTFVACDMIKVNNGRVNALMVDQVKEKLMIRIWIIIFQTVLFTKKKEC